MEGVPTYAQADDLRILLARYARPYPKTSVLDLYCGAGLCAIAAGTAEPLAQVTACDVNYQFCSIAESHASANSLQNVVVHHSDGFDHLVTGHLDDIYFYPPTHVAPTTVKKLIAQSLVSLRVGGRFWLASCSRRGGKSYRRWASELYGPGMRLARVRGYDVSVYVRANADAGAATQEAEQLAQEEMHSFRAILRGATYEFRTKANVFSWQEIDGGTTLLIEALPNCAGARILDLGCGYGAIGVVAARIYESADVTMCDIDRRALDLCRANADLNGCANAQVRVSDGFGNLRGLRYDLILSNFPTHVGKQQMWGLLRGAREGLRNGGRFMAVIQRDVAVDRTARKVFGNATTISESGSHRVFCCDKQRWEHIR